MAFTTWKLHLNWYLFFLLAIGRDRGADGEHDRSLLRHGGRRSSRAREARPGPACRFHDRGSGAAAALASARGCADDQHHHRPRRRRALDARASRAPVRSRDRVADRGRRVVHDLARARDPRRPLARQLAERPAARDRARGRRRLRRPGAGRRDGRDRQARAVVQHDGRRARRARAVARGVRRVRRSGAGGPGAARRVATSRARTSR